MTLTISDRPTRRAAFDTLQANPLGERRADAHIDASASCEAEVPWILWAVEHPVEALDAERWLDGQLGKHTDEWSFEWHGRTALEDVGAAYERQAFDDSTETSLGEICPGAGLPPRRDRSLRLRATEWGLNGLVIVALLLAGFLAYGRLDNRWYQLVTVEGGSMEPVYSPGDVLILTRPPAVLEPGMVVTLQVDGQVVTHRVVDVGDDGTFVTKGDANEHPDDFDGLEVRVVGLVRGHIPVLGRYLGGMPTNAWFTASAMSSIDVSAAVPRTTPSASATVGTTSTVATGPTDAGNASHDIPIVDVGKTGETTPAVPADDRVAPTRDQGADDSDGPIDGDDAAVPEAHEQDDLGTSGDGEDVDPPITEPPTTTVAATTAGPAQPDDIRDVD